MPKSRPHGDNGDKPPPPPPRRPRTSGAEEPDNIAAAQAKVQRKAEGGRGTSSSSAGRAGAVSGPAATLPLKPPNARHTVNGVRPSSRSADKNTMVMPGTDVAGDLADISAGRGHWQPQTNTYEVNGRTYKVEPTGTVIPVSGRGLVNLTRPEYKVLKELIGAEGDIAAAREALRRDPSVSDVDWTMAFEVFKYHKNYRGGA